MNERGSIGAADIGCLSAVGLAMIGEGYVDYRGDAHVRGTGAQPVGTS